MTDAATRRTGRTEKGERVATSILDAAIAVIADDGLAAASLQRIADRAAVDKRVLAYYFGDRDGLLAATAGRIGDELLSATEEAVADVIAPEIGLRIGFDLIWQTVVSHPRLHIAHHALMTAAITDATLRPHVTAITDRLDGLIRERATNAERHGWEWTIDKATMSRLLIAGLHGMTLEYLQRGETDELRAAITAYRDDLPRFARAPRESP